MYLPPNASVSQCQLAYTSIGVNAQSLMSRRKPTMISAPEPEPGGREGPKPYSSFGRD